MKNNDKIIIKGAKVHNLKNIDLEIPRNKLVVITGLSGSGKSSLAFDTIYAEAERRYVESLSAYARQFLGVMDKPDVDKIEGLSPAISIDQKSVVKNARSTVGTITEIYDYLRLFFARVGKPYCLKCGRLVKKQSKEQIIEKIFNLPKDSEISVLAPVIRGKKGEHRAILEQVKEAHFLRVRIDGKIYRIEEALRGELNPRKIHSVDVVVDRMKIEKEIDKIRLSDSVETALKLGKGLLIIECKDGARMKEFIFSEMFACPNCEINFPEIEPRIFSFNSPYGACPVCTGLGSKLEINSELVIPNKDLTLAEGAIKPWASASHKLGRQSWYWTIISDLADRYNFSLNTPVNQLPEKIIKIIFYGDDKFEGVILNLERRWKETDSDWTRAEIEKYMLIQKCPECNGRRLNKEAVAVKIDGKSIADIVEKNVSENIYFFQKLAGLQSGILNKTEQKIALPIIKEILTRLKFMVDVGLDYLTLDRESTTLAGGEAQRIRLATQIGSKLSGVTYILDEPSIGLHPRDHKKLIGTIKELRDIGNSVIVVEHDAETILSADWIIDIGPGAGKRGGEIIFEGGKDKLKKARTLTADYIYGRKKIEKLSLRQIEKDQKYIIIKGANEHNLKNIDVKIPLEKFVCVSGVSGSGKSTLINDILVKSLLVKYHGAHAIAGVHKQILGTENLDKIINIDQSPIGRTPRSNPATYTGIFTTVRDLFSKTHEAKIRGYDAGRFSFNVKGGRCENCEGQGFKKIEMYFLPDVYVECEECRGKRYNKEALSIEYKGKNIAQVLEMSVEEALKFFENIPALRQKLKILFEVGLGYIGLGQSAITLSGGEAQRIKLSTELSRKDTGRTLYVLDEPTTGLHFEDIKKLLKVLDILVDKGNSVLVIEHNPDVWRFADWIIDLGPDGGDKGGEIIAEGTLKDIKKNKKSYTAKFL